MGGEVWGVWGVWEVWEVIAFRMGIGFEAGFVLMSVDE